MKYRKLISKCFTKKSNDGYVAVALVAGLAAGAVLSLLFAPESGEDTRKLIGSKAKDLGNSAKERYNALRDKIAGAEEELEDELAPEIPHFVKSIPKKRKSDIKDLVDESHHQNEEGEA